MAELQKTGFLLDLTEPSVQQMERERTWGCGGGSLLGTSGGVVLPPALPLGLRITSLDRNVYNIGEDVAVRLTLTNTGSVPIRIPSSVDAGLVFSKDCKWLPHPGVTGLHGIVTLVLEDGSGQKDFIAGHELFGVSSDPNTFRELAPGESMGIKTAGKMNLYNIARERKKLNLSRDSAIPLTVTASFTMDDTPAFGGYRPVVSADALRITVRAE